jgi:DNA-binding Lrp family transcriptional regulator
MPKRKNPETSIEAYRSLNPDKLNEMYKSIITALSEIGEGTMEDIAKQIGCKSDKIWKRLSELSKNGIIHRPGNKRVLKSGKMGYTWMLGSGEEIKTNKPERSLKGKTVSDFSKKIKSIQKDVQKTNLPKAIQLF